MKKIFRKYTILIMTVATLIIMGVSTVIGSGSLKKQYYREFSNKIDQILNVIRTSEQELEYVQKNLDVDYLTRARAARYVIENTYDERSVESLQELAQILEVDEIHVIDEQGYIRYSSVEKYVGLDLSSGEQSRVFLSLLQNYDPDGYLIQDAMLNTAGNIMMQYVGICRTDKKGIIQVGFKPVRKTQSEERNTYSSIFAHFPVGESEEYFAISKEDGELLGCSNSVDTTVYNMNDSYMERL